MQVHPDLADALQMHLGELMPVEPAAPEAEQDVPAHKRRKVRSDFTDDATSVPFFDEANNFWLVVAAMVTFGVAMVVAARWRRWI